MTRDLVLTRLRITRSLPARNLCEFSHPSTYQITLLGATKIVSGFVIGFSFINGINSWVIKCGFRSGGSMVSCQDFRYLRTSPFIMFFHILSASSQVLYWMSNFCLDPYSSFLDLLQRSIVPEVIIQTLVRYWWVSLRSTYPHLIGY